MSIKKNTKIIILHRVAHNNPKYDFWEEMPYPGKYDEDKAGEIMKSLAHMFNMGFHPMFKDTPEGEYAYYETSDGQTRLAFSFE